MTELRKRFISRLILWNPWYQDQINFKTILILAEYDNLKLPIKMDFILEEPLLSLTLDSDNYLLITTQNIYSKCQGILNKLPFSEVEEFDENSFVNYYEKCSTENLSTSQIILKTKSGLKVPLILEFILPARTVIEFILFAAGKIKVPKILLKKAFDSVYNGKIIN